MPLRVELKPFERIVIGETVLVNSGTRTSFLIDGEAPLGNCSMTVYRPEGERMRLVEYGAVEHLEDSPARPTREAPHAPADPGEKEARRA